MPRKDRMNIGLIPSKSRYELECERLGSQQAVREFFRSEEVFEKIYQSHARQKENLHTLREIIGTSHMHDRSTLTHVMDQYDILVICGGDNHFTYCAQQVMALDRDTYVAGLVLDDKHSAGALLSFDTSSFLESLGRLEQGVFNHEGWTTLEGRLDDGTRLTPAIGDYLVAEHARQYMSRNHVWIDGDEALPEKSSGILIATGAGSQPGSWYSNVHAVYNTDDGSFPLTGRKAMLIATEHPGKPMAKLRPGQEAIIDSYNDAYGMIIPDSHGDHGTYFPMGKRAYIQISDSVLNVVRGDWS